MRRSSIARVAAVVALMTIATPAAGKVAMRRIKTIVIDPGHGGRNLGAIAITGVFEKLVTLDIALEVEKRLRERTDAEVILTRRDDDYVGLRERTRFANAKGADVFLSIHCNSESGHHGHGVETYFLSAAASDAEAARLAAFENERLSDPSDPLPSSDAQVAGLLKDMTLHGAQEDSLALAEAVLRRLVSVTRETSRGVKQAPFAVLKEAEMPAIVVEVGFLSHPKEAAELVTKRRQKKIADAIVDALIDFDRKSRYR